MNKHLSVEKGKTLFLHPQRSFNGKPNLHYQFLYIDNQ